MPVDNHAPTIQVSQFPFIADKQVAFTAILDDADGDAVVGALKVGDTAQFLMDRPGSFAVSLDSSKWPAGTQEVTVVLCDGWAPATYDLGPIQIKH
jgi:hypothetical protein